MAVSPGEIARSPIASNEAGRGRRHFALLSALDLAARTGYQMDEEPPLSGAPRRA